MDIIGRWLVSSYHNFFLLLRKLNFLFLDGMELSVVNVRCLFAIFGNISSCAHRLTQSSSHLLAFFLIKQKIYLFLIFGFFFWGRRSEIDINLDRNFRKWTFCARVQPVKCRRKWWRTKASEWDRRRERDLHIVTPLLKSYSQHTLYKKKCNFKYWQEITSHNGID